MVIILHDYYTYIRRERLKHEFRKNTLKFLKIFKIIKTFKVIKIFKLL